MDEALKASRGKKVAATIDDEAVELSMVPYLSPDEYEKTKHTRISVRIMGQLGKVEQTEHSWKILGADHYRRREVHLGRKVVGEWRKCEDAGTAFIIHKDIMNEEAKKLGINIKGSDVMEEFEKEINK